MSDRATRINEILYRQDPMHTCCNVNEGMEDEYRRIAEELAAIPAPALRQADLGDVLGAWFGTDDTQRWHDALVPVFEAIQALEPSHD